VIVNRILHVENDPDIREVVAVSLGLDLGLETRSSGSSAEALDIAVTWSPELILLDVMMPDMDGPSVLAFLREDVRTTRIPVVFVTARTQRREIDRLHLLGAAGVISKPFDPMTLAGTVRSYLGRTDFSLDAMRGVFLQRLRDDTAVLIKCRAMLDGNSTSSELLAKVRDIAHGLAGASGIFGCAETGDLAALLEYSIGLERRGASSINNIKHDLDRLIACAIKASLQTGEFPPERLSEDNRRAVVPVR
jgi:CheY-like chemotaxis protein